ncbi:sugar phosphate isomerase/epimerase [Cohnella lubricantis]|uniref:Sugar phosphate isomerase/epimerase n=1 Tax=Cohnella lubricantis TaxID=2163172 RepID=A0A841TJM8_9BACL|nr:sugar phosphate isomerase/epimerase [Cohnella lubricantis]MBB6679137.1 sugar phosphate isomerase/epimerase [Cohnella lubricantis]MBP2120169.1 sugar phosphate isomerase/epimerase [Cohnella lubricantis]
MKLGVSTYSLSRAMASGEMSVTDAIRWIAEAGGQHVEIVPFGFSLTDNPELIGSIVRTAAETGLEVSNYAVGANFVTDDEAAFEAEIRRVMGEVDIARALGAKRMRHDVARREGGTSAMFVRELPKLAEACRRIADYAAPFGITTSVENHGYYVQHSDRVTALVEAAGRPNFRLTMDVGNFMCADEESVSAVKKTISYASMVHLKDFYLRPASRDPGEGFFRTLSGNYLRGAIVGQGDIDMREALRVVKASGYDGYVSIEFEGMEECKLGTRIGLANARRMWDEV